MFPVLPVAGWCSQWAVAPFPFLSPTPTLRTAALLHWQPSSPLLTWSRAHHQHHNGVWSVKTFNWESGSFELHHFQPIQTGDVWLSLHLMFKQTWAAWRCWVPFAVFPFMFYLQINKSQRAQWLHSMWIHRSVLIGLQHPAVKSPARSFRAFIVSQPYQRWPLEPQGVYLTTLQRDDSC